MTLPPDAADWRRTPIPSWTEPPNWARLPIRECGEPLVALASAALGDDANITLRPLYAEAGIPGAPREILVRADIKSRLETAAASLRDYGAQLVVFDGYRPLAVQRYLYDSFAADLRARHPEATDAELRAMVAQFVAAPNADPACPPPHRTGGAVDVYLIEATSGLPLPMGTEPDETTPASATRWFEEHVAKNSSGSEEPYVDNRRILFHVMQAAGFCNYGGEWWHFDRGNQRWANLAGADAAIYGIPLESSTVACATG